MNSQRKFLWHRLKNKAYLGIAYDGKQTYLSSNDREIFILNDNCNCMSEIHTCRNYHTFCYDSARGCFFAASQEEAGVLFCLNDKFEETDNIHLHIQNTEVNTIDHLVYDSFTKLLYFTAENKFFSADQTGSVQEIFEFEKTVENIGGICLHIDYVIILSYQNEKPYFSIYMRTNGSILENQRLPENLNVSSMALIQESANPFSLSLRLLGAKQDNIPYLIDYKPNLGIFNQESIKNLSEEENTDSSSDIQMQQIRNNGMVNPFFNSRFKGSNADGAGNYQSVKQNIGDSMPCCPEPSSNGNNNSNNCKYCNSCDDCDNCDNCDNCDYGNNCNNCDNNNGNTNCCQPCCYQAYSDIIESIALTEASIAHVLNAEGEKLQKAIACSCNVTELLKVNESVIKTIIHSTHLEQTLFYKLESVLQADCCECPSHHCCDKNYNCKENTCKTQCKK